jgi:hypothetical protein
MILEFINFLWDKYRRWTNKENYEYEAIIKTGFRNEGITYQIKDKKIELEFYWPTLYLTGIEKWDNGIEMTETEKITMFVELLCYCKEKGSKVKVAIEKSQHDKDFWLKTSRTE